MKQLQYFTLLILWSTSCFAADNLGQPIHRPSHTEDACYANFEVFLEDMRNFLEPNLEYVNTDHNQYMKLVKGVLSPATIEEVVVRFKAREKMCRSCAIAVWDWSFADAPGLAMHPDSAKAVREKLKDIPE